jgi:hypothetical protein
MTDVKHEKSNASLSKALKKPVSLKGGLSKLPKKHVLLKGTASAVPLVLSL